jgi:aminopeptidase-like protein
MKLLSIVKKLEGMTRHEARAACRKLFARFGVIEEPYATGVNLVMRKPGTSKQQIVLAAHYDTFPGCTGANDDFSAIAVLYGIAQELWKKKPKHGLTLCIFDEEEQDCIGSRAYVKQHGAENIKAVIDLELVGNGSVVGLWPVVRETPLIRTMTTVLKKRKQHYEIGGELPMFWADYVPFRKAGVDSICITMIPKEEVNLIRPFVTQNPYRVMAKVALGIMKIPPFFQLYHSREDTADKLSEKSLQLAKNIVLDVIKELQK